MIKKYKLVKQTNLKDCGVCCLASILKYYKGYIPIEKLRQMTKTDKNGTTAFHLVEASKKLGFDSIGIKCTLEDISKNNITLPVIAHTIVNNSYKHFIVIYEIDEKNKKLIIADPMDKIKKISFLEFEKIFQKTLIILKPMKRIYYEKNKKELLKKIIKIVLENKKELIFVIMFSLFWMISNLLGLFFLKKMIDSNRINIIFIICLLVELLKIILYFIRNKIIISFREKINLKITSEIFKKIIYLPYYFYRSHTTGEMISRLNDLENVKNLIVYLFVNFILDITIIFSTSIIMYILNFRLLVITLIILLLHIIISLLFRKKILNKINNMKFEQDKTNTVMIETINGFECIKGLNQERNFLTNFSNQYKKYIKSISHKNNLDNLKYSLEEITSGLGIIFIIAFGILSVQNKQLTYSDLLIFITLSNTFLDCLESIFKYEFEIKDMIVSFKRLGDLYYDKDENISLKKINEIQIKNLNYSYNDIDNILEEINLKIKSKEKIMIIGESGCGKSTLLKLIKKYYESENVYINNENKLKNINIVYVSQNEFLFTGTLLYNITLNRNIDDEVVKEIISICEIEDIMKDKIIGNQMLIEENGFNISGGEKQRIVLARTLLTNADIYLLDESLSEVDVNLERKILKNIRKKYPEKTFLLVSHRKDNMDLFDKVYKFENKKIEVLRRRNEDV